MPNDSSGGDGHSGAGQGGNEEVMMVDSGAWSTLPLQDSDEDLTHTESGRATTTNPRRRRSIGVNVE